LEVVKPDKPPIAASMPWTHPHPQKEINGAAEQTNEQRKQKDKTNKQNKQTNRQARKCGAPEFAGR
jgi:hypothetical protein